MTSVNRTYLTTVQREYKNVSRRWVKGYCADSAMRTALVNLFFAYHDASMDDTVPRGMRVRYLHLVSKYNAIIVQTIGW